MTHDLIAERLVCGRRESLGVPASFIVDQLARGVPAARILDSVRSVVAEYVGAEGYTTEWGQIVEQTCGRFIAWRFVPVALWERLQSLRRQSIFLIPDLIGMVRIDVIALVEDHMSEGLVVSGRHAPARSHPHSLLTLLL